MHDDGPIRFVRPDNEQELSSICESIMGSDIGMTFRGRPLDVQITFMDPPVPDVRSSLDVTGRILYLLSSTFARLSVLVRSCVAKSRELQEDFRKKNNLPKSAKIPYSPAPVSDVDQAAMLQCVATIGALFGDKPSSYAMEKFWHATSSGDMRAFKIRLLFLKVRDSIKGSPMYRDFLAGLEDAISESERMAGCKPDSSPRRLSRAEQDRKRRIKERQDAKKRIQPELPLEWPHEESAVMREDGDPDAIHEEAEHKDGSSSSTSSNASESISQDQHEMAGITAEKCNSSADDSCKQVVNNEPELKDGQDEKRLNFNILKKVSLGKLIERGDETEKKEEDSKESELGDDYCKHTDSYGKFTVNKPHQIGDPIRKAREYDTVEQILDDIESGAIVRYESIDEIKEDLKSGKITSIDALMFTAALDRYCETDIPDLNDVDDEALECGLGDDRYDGEDDELEGKDNYEDYGLEDDHETSSSGTSFSYNPNGFCGVGGRFTDSGDWNLEDEW